MPSPETLAREAETAKKFEAEAGFEKQLGFSLKKGRGNWRKAVTNLERISGNRNYRFFVKGKV